MTQDTTAWQHGTALHGIHVPLITPFTADGQLAVSALEGLAHEVLDAGAAGLVALGTTAEAATLDAGERRTVIEVCSRVCHDRGAPLLIGAGSNDTRSSAVVLAELGCWPQAAGALVPVPYYTRPSEAGVIAHFTELAAASPLPLVIYHIPYRTALSLGPACLRALAWLPGVIGFKYSPGRIDQETMTLLGDLPDGFAVLAGDDALVSPLLALGAAGGILASAHLATSRFAELAAAWRDGDLRSARALGPVLARLSAAEFAEPNPSVIKGALHALGKIPSPAVRLPLLPAGADSVAGALAELARLDG